MESRCLRPHWNVQPQGVVVRLNFSSTCIRLERIATCWRSATKVNISNQHLNFSHACVGNLQGYVQLPEHRTHFHMKIEVTCWRPIKFHLQIIGGPFFRVSHGIQCCAKNRSSSSFKTLTIQVWEHLGRFLGFLMLCEKVYICMVQRACIPCLFVSPCRPHNRNIVFWKFGAKSLTNFGRVGCVICRKIVVGAELPQLRTLTNRITRHSVDHYRSWNKASSS